MKHYKVSLYGGYCYILVASSLEEAQRLARSDQGRDNLQNVILATDQDVAWARAMGGNIPELK